LNFSRLAPIFASGFLSARHIIYKVIQIMGA
jgi:hypothetical protein